jgi:hypothetical protein
MELITSKIQTVQAALNFKENLYEKNMLMDLFDKADPDFYIRIKDESIDFLEKLLRKFEADMEREKEKEREEKKREYEYELQKYNLKVQADAEVRKHQIAINSARKPSKGRFYHFQSNIYVSYRLIFFRQVYYSSYLPAFFNNRIFCHMVLHGRLRTMEERPCSYHQCSFRNSCPSFLRGNLRQLHRED